MTYDSNYRKCHYKKCDVPVFRPQDAYVATYAKTRDGQDKRIYYHLACFIKRWRIASGVVYDTKNNIFEERGRQ